MLRGNIYLQVYIQLVGASRVQPISIRIFFFRRYAFSRSETPVHMHAGSESFYVIAGRLGQRTPQGVMNVEAGHSMNGHPAGMTMEVFNSGTTELDALIMFVVDATKPFSTPAKFE